MPVLSKASAFTSAKFDKNEPPLNKTPCFAKLEIPDKVAGTALAANAQGRQQLRRPSLCKNFQPKSIGKAMRHLKQLVEKLLKLV